uniref:Na(+)-translocating NADH-quinone reductase subunit A n=1 Tax=Alistipes sp. TaxID=1872444 RepID=UPI0040576F7D
MSKTITLRKGLDIQLKGRAERECYVAKPSAEYALSPLDFEGVTPKLLVKVGDEVKAGQALFFNKFDSRVLFTSPVSGTVKAINRGEKRRVLSVTITPDKEQQYKEFAKLDPKKAKREQLVELLLEAGLWPMLIQRPYGRIADPDAAPKAIFISGFDSAPLAPDYDYVLANEGENLQAGLEVLNALTAGKVHLSLDAKTQKESKLAALKGVEFHYFQGKHPAGNVGVQIHHIDPINKGEVVWTVNLQDVAILGRLMLTGKVDMTRTIAVTGSEVEDAKYCRVVAGASLHSILDGNLEEQDEDEKVRIINGNVLTGVKADEEGFLGYYANQVTVIPEGDKYELFGWAMPRFKKFSVSRSYFSWLCPKKRYKLTTNLNGGERPFIVSGLYEEYLPMDIYPVYLLKACMAGDIDKMENLGIYEVLPEDFALCEFVDPSKIEMQQVIRDGINLMIKEA